MIGRPNPPEGLARTLLSSRRAGGRNPVWGAFILRAIGLLAIVVAICGPPAPARADCEVTDTGIPDDVAFKLDPGGGQERGDAERHLLRRVVRQLGWVQAGR